MPLGEDATRGAIVRLTPDDTDQVPIPIDNLMSVSRGYGAQDFGVPSTATGSVREYTQIGDGMHLGQQAHSLLPLLDQIRPQSTQRTVSVVGCHVLRYVNRTHHTYPPRYEYCHYLRMHLSRIDAFNIFHFDRTDTGYSVEQHASALSNVRLSPSTYALRFHPSSGSGTLQRLLNWKICLGMLCILAVQAVLRLVYQQLQNFRDPSN